MSRQEKGIHEGTGGFSQWSAILSEGLNGKKGQKMENETKRDESETESEKESENVQIGEKEKKFKQEEVERGGVRR